MVAALRLRSPQPLKQPLLLLLWAKTQQEQSMDSKPQDKQELEVPPKRRIHCFTPQLREWEESLTPEEQEQKHRQVLIDRQQRPA
jgi:hypothetical protein